MNDFDYGKIASIRKRTLEYSGLAVFFIVLSFVLDIHLFVELFFYLLVWSML
jgi:hypothetical protein